MRSIRRAPALDLISENDSARSLFSALNSRVAASCDHYGLL